MATKAEIAAAKAKETERVKNLSTAAAKAAAAEKKLTGFGTESERDYAKKVEPKFSEQSAMAKKIATKAASKPDFKPQGFTLDEFKQKAESIQKTGTEYKTKVTGITEAEQELAIAQGLITQYSTPIDIPGGTSEDDMARRDAFAILEDVFASYGLESLSNEIAGYMREGLGTGEATLRLKKSKAYTDRFKGNEFRLASGFNVINEAEYLDLENSYSQTLKAYGIQDYFGVGVTPGQRLTRQQAMAEVIGKDISAVEFKDRVSTSVDRVKMADPGTKKAFQDFYGVGETELVKYFLDPVKSLVSLKEKATAAEIGGAAIGQNLPATMASAEDLARFGINREQAQAGYSTIAQELPTAGSLGRIYSESGITYNQADAESATFKGLASAKRKKEQLKQLEEGQFSGSAGTSLGAGALSTQYLRKSSPAGQF
jgi:hypothetical protein